MKLSDMFSSLSRSAQDFEKRMDEWQKELSERRDDFMESARKWRADAEERDAKLSAQVKDYFDEASDQVKAQWAKAQKDWESEVARVRAKAEDMRNQATKLKDQEFADWSEAYAAQMVAYAQKMQEEAGNALIAAAEARAKADTAKKA